MTQAQVNLPVLLKDLWGHLSNKHRWQFSGLMGLMLVSALAEVVSLGAVIPFLGVLTAPEQIFQYEVVRKLADLMGYSTANELVLPLTISFVSLALLAGSIRTLLLWVSTRLAFRCGADLSIDVYRRTLYQPYLVQVSRNSSEIISGLTNKVSSAGKLIHLTLMMFASLFLLLFITCALIAVEPVIATMSFIVFGSSYFVIGWLSRKQLHQNSEYIAFLQNQVVKNVQEGLGAVRDILLDDSQEVYCKSFSKADLRLKYSLGTVMFTAASPKVAMESIGMVLIAILAYVLVSAQDGISSAIPTLGVLALGAQRMLPALQQAFSSYASLKGSGAALFDTIELLEQPMPEIEQQKAPVEPQLLQHDIALANVSFRYKATTPWVLQNINIKINKGERIGIVGSTGSGKSTMLDILMGLLPPSSGDLLVDNQAVNFSNCSGWKQQIAHVPQSIYLADSSLAENIAFGIPAEQIDLDRVISAAKKARIHHFIEDMDDGYSSQVGERGVKLSGGQRQRIGIARALYKNASVLVFDEATSALDNTTEQEVMSAIDELSPDLTIVMIAHRLSTVKNCDRIYELQGGKVYAEGNFKELIDASESFRLMAR